MQCYENSFKFEDVFILMIDENEKVTELVTKIAGQAYEARKLLYRCKLIGALLNI